MGRQICSRPSRQLPTATRQYRRHGSLIRKACGHPLCLQQGLPQEGYDQHVYLLAPVPRWRHRGHQGQRCCAEGSPLQGLPRKTGVVYNVTKTSVGVIIYKKVWGRYIEKRINVKVEHVSPSGSRDDFLKRVKENAQKKKEARANGTVVEVKRQPAQPRPAHTLSLTDNPPETLTPLPYETTI